METRSVFSLCRQLQLLSLCKNLCSHSTGYWDCSLLGCDTVKLGRWVAAYYQHIGVRPQKSEVLSFFLPSSPMNISVLTKIQLGFCRYENWHNWKGILYCTVTICVQMYIILLRLIWSTLSYQPDILTGEAPIWESTSSLHISNAQLWVSGWTCKRSVQPEHRCK
jgi:hypothetical protein